LIAPPFTRTRALRRYGRWTPRSASR
jgi:hypothetical protein